MHERRSQKASLTELLGFYWGVIKRGGCNRNDADGVFHCVKYFSICVLGMILAPRVSVIMLLMCWMCPYVLHSLFAAPRRMIAVPVSMFTSFDSRLQVLPAPPGRPQQHTEKLLYFHTVLIFITLEPKLKFFSLPPGCLSVNKSVSIRHRTTYLSASF